MVVPKIDLTWRSKDLCTAGEAEKNVTSGTSKSAFNHEDKEIYVKGMMHLDANKAVYLIREKEKGAMAVKQSKPDLMEPKDINRGFIYDEN